jgi:plasmid stability protein
MTVMLDEDVVRAVKVQAARKGKRADAVIEEALRRELGFELLDRMRASADLGDDEALRLAVEAQHESRRS